ncbi:MAG: DUF805 domain-containing protein [Caulobacteraceae bacterium]|nr:DUF805 domain-containing protein [Caulobacter sp.]
MSEAPAAARRAQTAGVLRDLLSFSGRLRRRGWWLSWMGFLLFTATVVFVGSPLIHYFEGAAVGTVAAGVRRSQPLVLACDLLLAWPAAAVMVRRGHDRGYAAARTLAVWGALVALGLLAPVLPFTPRLFAQLAILAYVVADYGVTPGGRGPNVYGADPRLAPAPP